jgi:nucleotide-binding universal stress UspA family protein
VVALFDGGGRALHALGQAVDLALRAKLPLRVLTAAEAGPEARTLTERAQRYMADHQIEGQVKLIPLEGEGEPALLEELLDAPRALIAMGAFGRPRVREWISGSTTLRILRDTANPILFYPF